MFRRVVYGTGSALLRYVWVLCYCYRTYGFYALLVVVIMMMMMIYPWFMMMIWWFDSMIWCAFRPLFVILVLRLMFPWCVCGIGSVGILVSFLGFLGCLCYSSGDFVYDSWFPRSMFPRRVCGFGSERIGWLGWSLRSNFPVRGLVWEAFAIPLLLFATRWWSVAHVMTLPWLYRWSVRLSLCFDFVPFNFGTSLSAVDVISCCFISVLRFPRCLGYYLWGSSFMVA